jgi:hypothetical protein
MPGVDGAQTRWALFRAVCPLFQHSKSLPTVEQADKGHYGHILDAALERLKNEITTLRHDIKFNYINELQAGIEQLTPSDINKLEVELESLLGMFEGLVDHQVSPSLP